MPNTTTNVSSGNRLTIAGASGAFSAKAITTSGVTGISGSSGSGTYGATFSAKNSNSIYGNSATAQPPAVTFRMYIKY